MAAAAILGFRGWRQVRTHPVLAVASGALGVAGESREDSVGLELVTERAIGAEAGLRIIPAPRINVPGMRKVDQDRALFLVARESQQVGLAGRRRPGSMALRANPGIVLFLEGVGVAGQAMLMPRPLHHHR